MRKRLNKKASKKSWNKGTKVHSMNFKRSRGGIRA